MKLKWKALKVNDRNVCISLANCEPLSMSKYPRFSYIYANDDDDNMKVRKMHFERAQRYDNQKFLRDSA